MSSPKIIGSSSSGSRRRRWGWRWNILFLGAFIEINEFSVEKNVIQKLKRKWIWEGKKNIVWSMWLTYDDDDKDDEEDVIFNILNIKKIGLKNGNKNIKYNKLARSSMEDDDHDVNNGDAENVVRFLKKMIKWCSIVVRSFQDQLRNITGLNFYSFDDGHHLWWSFSLSSQFPISCISFKNWVYKGHRRQTQIRWSGEHEKKTTYKSHKNGLDRPFSVVVSKVWRRDFWIKTKWSSATRYNQVSKLN